MNRKKLEALLDSLSMEKLDRYRNLAELEIIDDKIIDFQIYYKKLTGHFYHYSIRENENRKI